MRRAASVALLAAALRSAAVAQSIISMGPNGQTCAPAPTTQVVVQDVYYSAYFAGPAIVPNIFGSGNNITIDAAQTFITSTQITTTIIATTTVTATMSTPPIITFTTTNSAGSVVTSATQQRAFRLGEGLPSGIVTDLPSPTEVILGFATSTMGINVALATAVGFQQSIPNQQSQKKRALLGNTGDDCAFATRFALRNSALIGSNGELVGRNDSDAYALINPSPFRADVTTTFYFSDGILGWNSSDKVGAQFYQCADGSLYAGYPVAPFSGCTSVIIGGILSTLCPSDQSGSLNPTLATTLPPISTSGLSTGAFSSSLPLLSITTPTLSIPTTLSTLSSIISTPTASLPSNTLSVSPTSPSTTSLPTSLTSSPGSSPIVSIPPISVPNLSLPPISLPTLPTSIPIGLPTVSIPGVSLSIPTLPGLTLPTIVLPTSLPVSLPISLPISLPTSLPISLPLSLPTSLGLSLPLSLPTSLPISLPNSLPITLLTSLPITLPTSLPISVPLSLPGSLPITLPTSLPVTVPISDPISLPVSLPTSLPIPASLPVTSLVPTSLPVTSILPTSLPVTSILPTSLPVTLIPTSLPVSLPGGIGGIGGIGGGGGGGSLTTTTPTAAVPTYCPLLDYQTVEHGNYQYEIYCDQKIVGKDIIPAFPTGFSQDSAINFPACIGICDAWNNQEGVGYCVGVTYNGLYACYPYSSFTDVETAVGVQAARLLYDGYPSITDSPGSTPTIVVTSPTLVITTPTIVVTSPTLVVTSPTIVITSPTLVVTTPTIAITTSLPGGVGGIGGIGGIGGGGGAVTTTGLGAGSCTTTFATYSVAASGTAVPSICPNYSVGNSLGNPDVINYNGFLYESYCNNNIDGTDLNYPPGYNADMVTSVTDCINVCNQWNLYGAGNGASSNPNTGYECVGVVYGGPRLCYAKSKFTLEFGATGPFNFYDAQYTAFRALFPSQVISKTLTTSYPCPTGTIATPTA